MFLEKHGTAKFPMEEVTGIDQRFCPLCSASLTTAISSPIGFIRPPMLRRQVFGPIGKRPYAEKISLSSKNRMKPERTPNVPLIARTLIRMLRSNSATTGG